jgi:hypothetical protein
MSLFQHRSTRLTLPSLTTAALLLVTIGALPATAAAASATCDTTPIFFGLHGMGEGPSSTNPVLSPEIQSFDKAQNDISGAVLSSPVAYPTVNASEWPAVLVLHSIDAILEGETNLQAAIKAHTAGCTSAQDKVALVGYSMGAWVINSWILNRHYQHEWSMIRAVVLYGDPCWVKGEDQGLARRIAAGWRCLPAADYPFPKPGGESAVPFGMESWVASDDPVAGVGWGGKTADDQLKAAENCTDPKTCTHLMYPGSTAIVQGAQFVVSRLVG